MERTCGEHMLKLDSLPTIAPVMSFCDQMVGDWLFILVSSQHLSWDLLEYWDTEHRTGGLCKAAAHFSELNAFDASMSSMALVSLVSNMLYMAWTAASAPLLRPVHICSEILASMMSCFVTLVTHLGIILQVTSPTPMSSTSHSLCCLNK